MVTLLVLLIHALGAQGLTAQTFEVASVKLNRSGAPLQQYPILQPGGRVFAFNLPLRDIIRVAYGLEENQLFISSPLAAVQFDLEARAGANATNEQAVTMLRKLLAERFRLKAHAEKRQLPVYHLVRVNSTRLGPQIKPSGKECAPLRLPSGPGAPPPPPAPPPELSGTPLGSRRRWAECPSMFFPGGLSARAMDMHAFAIAIERLVRRPVIDKTGLAGRFDFDMTFTSEFDGPPQGLTGGNAPAFPTALREQLGLRIDSASAPVEVLIVDEVHEPTEN